MKFKYMLRGFGIGIVVAAAVMGGYTKSAVADARVEVLKEYGLGEESRVVSETEDLEETETMSATEQEDARDEEKESEIQEALDAAKDKEPSADGNIDPSDVDPGDADLAGADDADGAEDQQESPQTPSSSDKVVVVEPSDEEPGSVGSIDITIARGDDSGTVSRKLFKAGLIGDADEYDAYLMQHGYDKRLSAGTKSILPTDSWQEIAEKLTSQ